jgi:hypothetical protein
MGSSVAKLLRGSLAALIVFSSGFAMQCVQAQEPSAGSSDQQIRELKKEVEKLRGPRGGLPAVTRSQIPSADSHMASAARSIVVQAPDSQMVRGCLGT